MTTPLEVLVTARALVARGWCQGADARTAEGAPVGGRNAAAVQWCAVGAVEAASAGAIDARGRQTHARSIAIDRLATAAGEEYSPVTCGAGEAIEAIEDANDRQGTLQTDVLAWFDSAISGARAEDAAGA